jgi:RNA polymerase sigma-70 factor, ECF subfamily
MVNAYSYATGPRNTRGAERESMEDQIEVAFSRTGYTESFRVLVERYGRVLQGTAYLMTKDAAVAEELTQDALLSAWRGIRGFNEDRPIKPWLVRILVNRVLEHQRRSKLPTMPLDDAPELRSTDSVADEVEARDSVSRGLALLDEDHRQVLMLRYFAELTTPEIAKSLGCPEGTVKSRLHRATAELRVIIGE